MKKKILWLGLSFLLVAALMLTACPAAVGEQEEEEEEEEEEEPLILEGQGLAPVTDETIVFQGWAFATHIPEANTQRYNDELGGNVDYMTVTGDYPVLMEMKLLASAPLDFIYAEPIMASRYYEGGWIVTAEEMPNIEEIKANMYPGVLDAWSYDGKLLGLPYFSANVGIVRVNLKLYNELGFTKADYPTTWDELYDQLYELKDAGCERPYQPWWSAEWFGMSNGFAFEVLNRGGQVADGETYAPMVTVDGPAGDTLRDWKRIMNDGLVDIGYVGAASAEGQEAWASGMTVFSPGTSYSLKRSNDPDYSTFAGYCSFLPYAGQSWGNLNSALYLMTDRPRSPEHTDDLMRFASWYGYKDQDGLYAVSNYWVQEEMLFSPYKPVMEDPVNVALIRSYLADPDEYELLIEIYETQPFNKGAWMVVWGMEFNTWCSELLQRFLLEDLPVDETIEAITNKINELNAFYGINQ